MAERHRVAVEAIQKRNVPELCKMLAFSAEDAAKHSMHPHEDAACRLIACHIAGVCNGDHHFLPYYQECYEYCLKQAELDRLAAPDRKPEPQPNFKSN